MGRVVWFSILKYIEIVITAGTIFLVAKKVGPTEMGKSISVLLYVTYSNYLILGLSQVVTKNLRRIESNEQISFMRFNLQYILIVCLVNLFSVNYFVAKEYFYTTYFVSCGVIIKSYFMAYFRSINRIEVLNKNNIIFSISLFIFTVFFADTWKEYMIFWAMSLWFSLFLYFYDGRSFFFKIIKTILSIPTKKQICFNLSEGIKLALTSIITTILLTADRIIVNNLSLELATKGAYQLADNFGMAIYMVLTTVIFYYYPDWIQKMREDHNFQKKYLKYLSHLLFIYPIGLLVIFLVAKLLNTFVFVEYIYLDRYILLSSVIKLNVILISALAMVYVSHNKEVKYIISMLPLITLCLGISLFYILYQPQNVLLVPLSIGLLLFVAFLAYFLRLRVVLLSPDNA